MNNSLRKIKDSILNKEDILKVKSIIEELEGDEQIKDFAFPVDHIRFNLLDYPLIIKRPMDLSTLKVSSLVIF